MSQLIINSQVTQARGNFNPRILIVDDEPAIADMLEMLLEDDYQVTICLRSPEALQRARLLSPDLLIIDLMMPSLNGVELLHNLRAEQSLADVPAILMTASTNLSHAGITESELANLKAVVLHKPFNNQCLLDMIHTLCA